MSKATPTTSEILSDRQAKVADARKAAQAILDALDLAEGCETAGSGVSPEKVA